MAFSRDFSRPVHSRQRLTHMIAARVDGTGTAALLSGSSELTLTDNGPGDYTLTFSEQSFVRIPVVLVTPVTTGVVCNITPSVSNVQIEFFDTATGAAATDADFHVVIIGSDAQDET